MKNISRTLFSALSAVCAAALVLFLVQLIIINSGEEPRAPESIVSAVTPGQDGGGPDADGLPDGDGLDWSGVYEPVTRPPPQGTRWEIQVDDGNYLVIYAKDELFSYVENDLDWSFVYKGGGSSELVISFWFMTPQGAAANAEAFLNRQIEGTSAEFKGTQNIVDSDMTGFSAQAQSGGITYEAWLYRLSNDDLALAFMVNYEFTGQREDLYEVLSSMSIEQGTASRAGANPDGDNPGGTGPDGADPDGTG